MQTEIVSGFHGQFEILALDAGIRLSIKQFGAHQVSNLSMILDCISWGDQVLDIGAHVGTFAVPFARKAGPNGLVIAVEGTPDTHTLLERNITLNNIPNIIALNRVVSDEAGAFNADDGGTLHNYNTAAVSHRLSESGEGVQGISIDNLVRQYAMGPIACIKVDVEGMDYKALSSGAETIRQCRPIVSFEAVFRRGVATKFAKLFGRNYAFFVNVERTNYDHGHFTPFLLDRFEGALSAGQHDVFAVPHESPIFARWSAYLGDKIETSYRRAKQAALQGDKQGALDMLGDLSRFTTIDQMLFISGLLTSHGQAEVAAAQLKEILAEEPDQVDALLRLANLYRMRRDFTPATDLLEHGMRIRPMASAMPLLLARIYAAQRMFDKASGVLAAYTERFGPHPRVLLAHADLEWRQKHRETAIDLANQSLSIRPTDVRGRRQIATYLIAQHRADDAATHIRLALATRPNDPVLSSLLNDIVAPPARPSKRRADDYSGAALNSAHR